MTQNPNVESPWAQARIAMSGNKYEDNTPYNFTSVTPDEVLGLLTIQVKRWLAIQDELRFNDTEWLGQLAEYASDIFLSVVKDDEQMPRYNSGYVMNAPDLQVIQNADGGGMGIVLVADYGEAANAIMDKAVRISIIPFDAVMTPLFVAQAQSAQTEIGQQVVGSTIDLDDILNATPEDTDADDNAQAIEDLPEGSPEEILGGDNEPPTEAAVPVTDESEAPTVVEPVTDTEDDPELVPDPVLAPDGEPITLANDEPEPEPEPEPVVSVDATEDTEPGDDSDTTEEE